MTFIIPQTKTTPFAEFKEGNLIIKGKSVPFEQPSVYDIINKKLANYAKNPENRTQIDFYLSEVNALSKRHIVSILKLLEKLKNNGIDINVNWYCHPDNEDIQDFGEICKTMCNLNFHLKESDPV
jgi:hypothetical protein